MGKDKEILRNEKDILVKNILGQSEEDENLLLRGYATLIGWNGPKRCFFSLTNARIIILWLRKRFDEVESIQKIPFTNIESVSYKYSPQAILFAIYIYNQKPFTQRLNIKLKNEESLAFAFDDRDFGKNMHKELKRHQS